MKSLKIVLASAAALALAVPAFAETTPAADGKAATQSAAPAAKTGKHHHHKKTAETSDAKTDSKTAVPASK